MHLHDDPVVANAIVWATRVAMSKAIARPGSVVP
jgi:hypothetical protein